MDKIFLWEILVPTVRNDGRSIKTRFHRVWDQKVRSLTGGLTIFAPAKGQWVAPSGDLYSERMIPVRIMCSETVILDLVKMTKSYYEQLAVMYYRLSDEVKIYAESN